MNKLFKLGLMLAGITALALASRKPWFQTPAASLSESKEVQLVEPKLQQPFRHGAGLAALAGVVSTWKPLRRRGADTLVASLALTAVLCFPILLIVFESQIAARAAWLQGEFEHVVWLGGDVNVGFEASANGRSHRYLVVDPPNQYRTAETPDWSPSEVGLTRLPYLFDWTGYDNPFCQFVGKGWLLAVVGGASLLIGSMTARPPRLRRRFLTTTAVGCVGLGVALTMAWTPAFAAGLAISDARNEVSQGRPAEALAHLKVAAEKYPFYALSTPFVQQTARLENQLGLETPAASLAAAQQLEASGCSLQAIDVYRSLVVSGDPDDVVTRLARLGLVRQAVYRLNRGHESGSLELLDEVLASDVCELKALLVAQLAAHRLNDVRAVDELTKRIYAICEPMRFPTKKIPLSEAQRRAVATEFSAGLTEAAWRRLPKTRRP